MSVKITDKMLEEMPPGRHFLETSHDPIAMVIRVELFTLKPNETIHICSAWFLMHGYVTGGVCLAGLVGEYTMAIEYRSVTSSKIFFQHFHDYFHISVKHDEKPPHAKFDMNRFVVAQDMAV